MLTNINLVRDLKKKKIIGLNMFVIYLPDNSCSNVEYMKLSNSCLDVESTRISIRGSG
jgi:hypothetical protein